MLLHVNAIKDVAFWTCILAHLPSLLHPPLLIRSKTFALFDSLNAYATTYNLAFVVNGDVDGQTVPALRLILPLLTKSDRSGSKAACLD